LRVFSETQCIGPLYLLLLLSDGEAAHKHTDIQNMTKAANIKDNSKKTYTTDAANVFHTDTELSNP